MGSKKSGAATVRPSGKDHQGKSVRKDARVSKMKSEATEEKLGVSIDEMKVVKKTSRSEIDEIFGNKKRKVPVVESCHSTVDPGATEDKKKKKKAKGTDPAMHVPGSSDKATPESGGKLRKKTIDGFTLYAEEEIGWNKRNAGGTPLCPFDCQCCF